MSIDKRLSQVMADVFDMPPSEIGPKTSVDSVETWDSMLGTMLVTGIEDEFKVHLTDKEIMDMMSYELIKEVLQEKGVA